MTPCPCPRPQVRRAIQQMLFQGKDFSWIRHVTIAVVLLTFINLLVIFAPSILGIFGMIGVWQRPAPVPRWAPGVVGSTPAWCWALPDPPVPQFPLLTVPGPGDVGGVPIPISVPAGSGSRGAVLVACRTAGQRLLFPWVFPLIPQAGLPPPSAPGSVPRPWLRRGGGGGCVGMVPGHGVPGFLEGFARAGDGGAGGDTHRTWPDYGAGRTEPWGGGPLPALVPVCFRCHLCSMPHLHLPCHLLHSHHAQGQGAAALHPQNLGKHEGGTGTGTGMRVPGMGWGPCHPGRP